ncbi:Teneurin-4 [Taenia solium]|eukprot:TsM_000125400 transcript=TsM_000125400 gene=TsM_000125400
MRACIQLTRTVSSLEIGLSLPTCTFCSYFSTVTIVILTTGLGALTYSISRICLYLLHKTLPFRKELLLLNTSGVQQIHLFSNKRRCHYDFDNLEMVYDNRALRAHVLLYGFRENAKWLENRLHEKYAQDPAIFGLFNPHNPPRKIEPNTQVKIRLEPMGLWAGHWHIQSDLCTIYNITLTSELSSVGVFLRYSTMPTIVHYSHFDRILGRQLKADTVVKKDATDLPKEAFPSVPSAIHMKPNAPRTTGRVRCLKKGHWFISIVNDQPRTEDIILSMAETVMPRGCPNDCSNRGICSQGVCDCLNGLTGKDCSSGESWGLFRPSQRSYNDRSHLS